MKVISVLGVRPQNVRLKPTVDALTRMDSKHLFVHTGKHDHSNMTKVIYGGPKLPDLVSLNPSHNK